jgi:hypothetical protein
MKQTSNTTYLDYTKLKIRKINKTRMIVGEMTVNREIDNTFLGQASIYVKQGNEYRLMPYRLPPKGFCDTHNEDIYFFPQVVEASDWTLPLPCPPAIVLYY